MDGNSMMQQVDDQFLSAMGLDGLKGDRKQKALDNILFTLNANVGQRVAEVLNEEQLDEFDRLTVDEEAVNQDTLTSWLDQNVPNYKQIIEEEAQKMKDNAAEMQQRVMGTAS